MTGQLLHLDAPVSDIDSVLRELWTVPATAQECSALLDAYADKVPHYPTLATLPSRTFVRAGAGDSGTALQEAALLSVAVKVQEAFPKDDHAARDAAVVLAYAETVSATQPGPAARGLGVIDGVPTRLADSAFTGAAHRLSRREPRFRAALLAAAPAALRARLAACWTEAGHRGRWGRGGMPTAQRNELVEVALRLRRLDATEPGLESWARAAVAKRMAPRQLDAYLREDRELRAALKELVAEGRDSVDQREG